MKQIDYVTRENLKEVIEKYTEENMKTIGFVRSVPTTAQILLIIKTGSIKKVIKNFVKFQDSYYYMYSRGLVMDADDNYYYTSSEQLKNKFIFVVGNEQISLFDLYDISDEDIITHIDKLNFNQIILFKMVYSHFVNKKDYVNAELVYKEMLARHEYNDGALPLISYTSNDYIPLLTYCDKADLVDKSMIAYYLKAVYNKQIYIANDFDREFYKKMQRKYSEFFRLANVSAYLIDDAYGSRNKPDVSNFDLVDSDPVVRERVFRVFDGPSGQILKEMIDEDFDRVHKMVINFMNTQYYKGKKKKQFISTYSRIKDIFETKGHKLDVFQLNEDLQSHIVFDMLN